MDSIRTFIAVDVDNAVRNASHKILERLANSDATVRWVEKESLHVTLKFLGEVASVDTPRVCQIVGDIARQFSPFSLQFCGTGAFPDIQRPRTVWLGIDDDEGSQVLEKIHKAMDDRLMDMGFLPESRRFHPHLTLGRVKSGRNLATLTEQLAKTAESRAGSCTVRELVVYASYLEKSGPSYQTMARVPLLGEGGN